MLRVNLPTVEEMRTFEAREERQYWSVYLPIWLRKWGFLLSNNAEGFVIAARSAAALDSHECRPGVYEGPFTQERLGQFGATARDVFAHEFNLRDGGSGECMSPYRFGCPLENVRRIPVKGGDRSEPYRFESDDPLISDKPVALQLFRESAQWRALAYAYLDGADTAEPVAVTNGKVVLLGLPLFDLLAQKHWIGPLPAGYYSMARSGAHWGVEVWLVNVIRASAMAAGYQVLTLDHWPLGRRAALTIRHDLDRPIGDAALHDLLSFHRSRGVKASWGFLARLAPPDQINAICSDGHELILHTEARTALDMQNELAQVAAAAGQRPTGVTCHGGIGSGGYLGESLFEWSEAEGLEHAELLGRENHLPHPVLRRRETRLAPSAIMAPPCHMSLDLTTAPDGHALTKLQAAVPTALAAGGHVTVMNHPDIHVSELKCLVDGLSLDDVWKCTHREALAWARISKFGADLRVEGDLVAVRFAENLPHPATLRLASPEGVRTWQVDAGRNGFSLSLTEGPAARLADHACHEQITGA